MVDLNMLENFSLLIPSKDFKTWKGHILLNVYSIYVEISCPNMPLLDNLKIKIPEFEAFNFWQFDLNESVEIIKQKTHSLPEFLKELIPVLVKVWKEDPSTNLRNLNYVDEKFYSLIQEVNLYGQFVHEIDENLKHITFNVLDMCKHNHFIKILIPEEYPMVKKQPLCFETIIPSVGLNLLLKMNSITNLFEMFKKVVNEFNHFWNVYNEIITTCNTIGSYTFKDVNYRIPIDSHVCVEVEVDPLNPLNCPKFNLHGLPASIEKFQERLNEINPSLIWSTENSFKENILNVFQVATLQLQYKDNSEHCIASQNDLICCICYDQLDTAIKKQTKSCANDKCDALYHMSCICEWLLNSGSTPMFEHLQGKCPQCEEDMLVALENFDLIKT
ncbi:E3 ubiquitin-protein ligase FANCL isoform X1 [Rhopalosiphum maidis]|uniref:E3 ubiquitin-protein ligase FANCL isoform X1 n=1 Tax=Rhopalosiphum maidis TaxID=43146 RepID=UPI000EFE9D06|nr:E3 ubiquitin-protein ligase FANCL isoform X1 [Rhopalosiphum maidis]